MPPEIGSFISDHVYNGLLKSNPRHRVKPSTVACHFIDVNGHEQLDKDGKSSFVRAALVFRSERNDANCVYRTNKKSKRSFFLLSTSRMRIFLIGLSHPMMHRGVLSKRHSKVMNSTGMTNASMLTLSKVRLTLGTHHASLTPNAHENRKRRPGDHYFCGPHQGTRFLDQFAAHQCHAYPVQASHVHCVKASLPRRQRC
jgi:hypothetical protein